MRVLKTALSAVTVILIFVTVIATGQSAAHAAGNDYPWQTADPGAHSPLGFNYRNCTDFAAWRLNTQTGATSAPWRFTWSTLAAPGGNGHAIGWKDGAIARGYRVDDSPQIGSVAWWGGSRGGGYGHVAIVTAVAPDGSVTIEQYNAVPYAYSVQSNVRAEKYLHITDVHAANRGVLSLAGNWSGDARQDFAYVTRRADGGFDFAVMETTATGLAWRGVWWSAPGLSFATTKFIPADTDSDGLLDLYYATVGGGGFALALMHNAGGSFTWWGHHWNPQLDLATVRFLPGDWTGDSRDEFAYVTPSSSGGFGFAVMETTDAGLVWRGLWWLDNNLAYASTAFIPADNDNDGKLDLFYASPSPTGFAVALMHNTGSSFAWWGHQWNPAGITLSTTRFLPGDWGGGPEDDFAYVTPRSDGGFDLARFISTPSGIVWQDGLHEPNLAFSTVQFITADADADGYSDLYYVTPRAGSGFDMALFHNTGSGFVWSGPQWSPVSLTQQQTAFLPQR